MRQRFLALALVCVLLLGLAVPVSAEVTSESSLFSVGDGVERSYERDASGPNWSYSAASHTLTLNGLNISKDQETGYRWLEEAIWLENPRSDFTILLADGSVNNVDILHEDAKRAMSIDYTADYAIHVAGSGTLKGYLEMDGNLVIDGGTLYLQEVLSPSSLTMNGGTVHAGELYIWGEGKTVPLVMNGGILYLDRDPEYWMNNTLFVNWYPDVMEPYTSFFRVTDPSGVEVALEEQKGDEYFGEDCYYYFTKAEKLVVTSINGCRPEEKKALPEDIPLKLKYDSFLLPAVFSESYFSHSARQYDGELAWLTLCLELSAFTAAEYGVWGENGDDNSTVAQKRYANIQDAYKQMGFDAEYYNYGVSLNDTSDKAAFSIATKKLSDGSTLVAAVVRGGGYGGEWASNFHLSQAAMDAGYHQGFYLAADKVYNKLVEKLDTIQGPVKLWITGYSRGAATANIVAGRADNFAKWSDKLTPEDVYAYTFATPRGVLPSRTPEDALYGNIFNIVNPGDVVPRVAPEAWGYSHYGVTLTFDRCAGNTIFDKVNQAHKNLFTYGTDAGTRLKAVGDDFRAGRNAKNQRALDAVLKAATTLFPDEDKARKLLSAVSDLVALLKHREYRNGGWEKLTTEEIESILREKYNVASIDYSYGNSSTDTVRATLLLQASNILETFLEKNDTVQRVKRAPQEVTAWFIAIAKYYGVSETDLVFLLFRMCGLDLDALDDAFSSPEREKDWSDVFRSLRDMAGGPAIGFVKEKREKVEGIIRNVKRMLEECATGHDALTYLAWLSIPPEEAFDARFSPEGYVRTDSHTSVLPSGWAEEEVNEALEAYLVPTGLQEHYKFPVSRLEVCDMFVALIEEVTEKDINELLYERNITVDYNAFTDTDNPSVLVMNALGILKGVGNGKFDPKGTLNRGQAAAIVNRVARLLGVDTDGYFHIFPDVAGTWVDGELGWPAAMGIVKGMEDGRFHPNDTLTVEQAVLIVNRALKALKG